MARHADELSPEQVKALKTLLDVLRGQKPDGWSMVFGHRELVVRPADREVGKFSIRFGTNGTRDVSIMFYSKRAGIWQTTERFKSTDIQQILSWLISVAAAKDESGTK